MKVEYFEKNILSLIERAKLLESDVIENIHGWDVFNSSSTQDNPPCWLTDSDDYVVRPFEYICEQIYNSLVVYLDYHKMGSTLDLMHKILGADFNNKSVTNIGLGFEGELFLIYLSKLSSFVEAIGLIRDPNANEIAVGIIYLERILKNTAVIIAKSGITPASETQVYKAVKNMIEMIFTSSINAKGAFFKKAQEYKPDILIPELSAAIEYKFADSDEKLKLTIAQISDDVKGYDGERDYSKFYAVFYVKKDLCGVERFRELWNEKKFPPNWKGYYIVGQ